MRHHADKCDIARLISDRTTRFLVKFYTKLGLKLCQAQVYVDVEVEVIVEINSS